jgi:uncharacterized SAM-binding protein YcdF (DUF218 family)
VSTLRSKSWPSKAKLAAIAVLPLFFIFTFWLEFKKVTGTRVNSWEQDLTSDCGIVLTGGASRVREGLDLLATGQIKRLVISGVYSGARLRDIFPLEPFYGNLPLQNVVLERRSETTYGNANQTLPIVEALNCRDVTLVTGNLHMYRAKKTFLAIYPQSLPILTHAVISGRAESGFSEVSTEVLKSLFYSLWAY